MDVQDTLEEGVEHGASVGDGVDILLHIVPVPQTPGRLGRHQGHALAHLVIACAPILTGQLTQLVPVASEHTK